MKGKQNKIQVHEKQFILNIFPFNNIATFVCYAEAVSAHFSKDEMFGVFFFLWRIALIQGFHL